MDNTIKLPLTQKELVLNYLRSGAGISAVKAQNEFRCYRLAAVVHRLRGDGWRIKSVPKLSFTGQRYAQYYLI
jgi:hypothetical protein